jgi:hypothetical protein
MSQEKPVVEEGLAEWIMSYADMITILMAFFVVMYSMAGEKNAHKQEAVLESLRSWLGPLQPGSLRGLGISGVHGAYPGVQPRLLGAKGTTEPGNSGGKTGFSNWRDLASIGASVYFDETAASLTPTQQQQLARICELVSGKRQLVEIRALPSRRLIVDPTAAGDEQDRAWSKCRMVSDYLVEQGIERSRLQLAVVTPGSELDDPNLLDADRDFRVDVNLSQRFLRTP